MSSLQTFRLKPNPAGKDKNRSGASATQLAAEWVDLKNVSASNINLAGVRVCHVAYKANGTREWEDVQSFSSGLLSPGKVVRIHSGSGPESAISQADLAGADFHIFTHKNYIWNNDKSDCCGLFASGENVPFDTACYDGPPPEGVILVRAGDKLVAPAAQTSAYARR